MGLNKTHTFMSHTPPIVFSTTVAGSPLLPSSAFLRRQNTHSQTPNFTHKHTMNCSIKPSTLSFPSSNPIPKKGFSSIISKFQSLPSKPFIFKVNPSSISITHKKPIFYISQIQDFGGLIGKTNHETVCNAYEAQPVEIKMDQVAQSDETDHLQPSETKMDQVAQFDHAGHLQPSGIKMDQEAQSDQADHLQPLEIKMHQVAQFDQVEPLQPSMEIKMDLQVDQSDQVGKKMKIGLYFAMWWSLNVVFNIYNKKALNAFPFPWLTSTLCLACGSLIMLVSWCTKMIEAPKTDVEFWKTLFPVALAHTIGTVAAMISLSKVAVSFTHIIKSSEPAFSVFVSRLFLGETFPISTYLSLLPIIGGCALSAFTEFNLNVTGFMGAMISNLAFVFRNIFSKKGMKGKSVSGLNYYACLSMLSLLILIPFAIAMEGPQVWEAGWRTALTQIGPNFVWWVVALSVLYHLNNQVSYMSLDQISPLTFSVGNTMKRIFVIVSSIIIFRTPVQPVNALGAAIAILGTLIYSRAKP